MASLAVQPQQQSTNPIATGTSRVVFLCKYNNHPN